MKYSAATLQKKVFTPLLLLVFIGGILSFSSCSSDDDNITPDNPELESSALYDTLGWFIQGAEGPVKDQGTKMIPDPDNSGQEIQAGRLAIRTVVDEALGIIASDPELADYFPTLLQEVDNGNTTGYANLLSNFTDFVQQGVSGQEIYEGKSMLEAHNHETYDRFGSEEHPVADEASFNEFIGDVVQAAQNLDVPQSVITQLGGLLSSVKGDVVQG